MPFLQTPGARVFILALAHVTVDFYGGLLLPLPEPTLVNHLGVGLSQVMTLIVAGALVCNAVQPLSAAILPAAGLPALLLVCPLLAAGQCLLGLSTSYAVAALLLLVSSAGIGLLHPEGALAVQALGGQRRGLALSIFMSGGYFGFSLGGFVAGRWAAVRGLEWFWLLVVPALVLCLLVLASGLHRLHGHGGAQPPAAERHGISFLPIFLVALGIAANFCIFVRMLPVYLFRQYGAQAQAVAGDTMLATGIAGALGAWFWGHLSDRIGCGRAIAIAQAVGAPCMYALLYVAEPGQIPLLGIGVGLTLGSIFPLSVALARGANGFSQRARMGLCIGGAWGIGEVFVQVGTFYIDRFAAGQAMPVLRVLGSCWFFIGATFVLSLLLAGHERRASRRQA